MFRQSEVPIYGEGFIESILNAYTSRPAAALMIASLRLHLFTVMPNPIPTTWALIDFTECTFGGYTFAAGSIGTTIVNLPNGNGKCVQFNGLFFADGTFIAPGETAVGYALAADVGSPYIAERFADPVPFAAIGDSLNLTVLAGLQNPVIC